MHGKRSHNAMDSRIASNYDHGVATCHHSGKMVDPVPQFTPSDAMNMLTDHDRKMADWKHANCRWNPRDEQESRCRKPSCRNQLQQQGCGNEDGEASTLLKSSASTLCSHRKLKMVEKPKLKGNASQRSLQPRESLEFHGESQEDEGEEFAQLEKLKAHMLHSHPDAGTGADTITDESVAGPSTTSPVSVQSTVTSAATCPSIFTPVSTALSLKEAAPGSAFPAITEPKIGTSGVATNAQAAVESGESHASPGENSAGFLQTTAIAPGQASVLTNPAPSTASASTTNALMTTAFPLLTMHHQPVVIHHHLLMISIQPSNNSVPCGTYLSSTPEGLLQQGNYAKRVEADVCLLDGRHGICEVTESAGNEARRNDRETIVSTESYAAINNDEELNVFYSGVTVA
ncbi:unnamed protein product [Darwinula stevensoni]|uniref:Uncharacterized protein n=1 Tax=Darwinula stevensoni TaxID=69355 RepID=A0A7R9A8W2_9CRUS|nr:unnamed protein product [Darwinula stevensoni]CAG0896815.1 unnamed protein product [Darwinula stevensoni]